MVGQNCVILGTSFSRASSRNIGVGRFQKRTSGQSKKTPNERSCALLPGSELRAQDLEVSGGRNGTCWDQGNCAEVGTVEGSLENRGGSHKQKTQLPMAVRSGL